jgi:hypothetical protein
VNVRSVAVARPIPGDADPAPLAFPDIARRTRSDAYARRREAHHLLRTPLIVARRTPESGVPINREE